MEFTHSPSTPSQSAYSQIASKAIQQVTVHFVCCSLFVMRAVFGGSSRSLASAIASSSRTSLESQTRSLTSTATNRAGAGHAASSTDDQDYTTNETFGSPIWRNTILLIVGSFVGYRAWQVTQRHNSSSSHDSDSEQGAEAKLPWLTRYMAYYTTAPEVWKERSSAHFEAARKLAEDKLFFQETVRPPVQRLKYTQLVIFPFHLVPAGSELTFRSSNLFFHPPFAPVSLPDPHFHYK